MRRAASTTTGTTTGTARCSRCGRRTTTTSSPILSSVDNGWLATGIRVVANAVPELSARAGALFDSMDFGFYYQPEREPDRRSTTRRAPAGSPCCYDTIVSESRIASYIGIAQGRDSGQGVLRLVPDVPGDVRLELARDPAGRVPSDLPRRDGLRGCLPVRGLQGRPGLGREHVRGAHAHALPPRGEVGPRQLGGQPPADDRRPRSITASWRRSTATGAFRQRTSPRAATREYGVDAIGMRPDGYKSNNPPTEGDARVDRGFGDCPGREPQPDPPPSAYTNGVVTPHAAFLALRWAPGPRDGEPRQPARRTSTSTTDGGSATRSTSTPAPCPSSTCPSTRASSWPRSAMPSAKDVLRDVVRDQGLPEGPPARDRHGDVQRRDRARPPTNTSARDHRLVRPDRLVRDLRRLDRP